MERLANLQKNLLCENYAICIPLYMYYLYGGNLFTIEKKVFKVQFNQLIKSLSNVLTTEQTIMTRNFSPELSKNAFQSEVLKDSLNIVCCSMNKGYMEEISEKLCENIFQERDYVRKEEFIQIVAKIVNQKKDETGTFLSFYINLLRVEFQLVEEKQQQWQQSAFIQEEGKVQTGSSFYSKEMHKILKKCPYNGDPKCECKKCHCVRRNRDSARLSQEKKRSAVEQLEPLKKKVQSLEMRNIQLEEQNMMLKAILSEFKKHPQINSIIRGTIEPISKIINDQ